MNMSGKKGNTALVPVAPPAALARQNDPVADWQSHLDLLVRSGQISGDTARTYKIGMRKFREWVEAREKQPITNRLVLEWMAEMREKKTPKGRPTSPQSINTWLNGVRHFFGWAYSEGIVPANPTAEIKSAGRGGAGTIHKRKRLTDEEVIRLLDSPYLNERPRDKALIYLMLYAAVRGIEVHRADVDDLQTEGDEMVLRVHGKARDSKEDEVIIASPDARKAIYDYLAQRGTKAGPLFLTIRKFEQEGAPAPRRLSRRMAQHLVGQAFKAVGIKAEAKTMHSLRHSAITNAILNGASVHDAQAMARHRNPGTTMIYFTNVDRRQNAAEKRIDYRKKR